MMTTQDQRRRGVEAASLTPSSPPDLQWPGRRVLVESVTPCVDGGAYPAKRVLGDRVEVQADLVADSHDVVTGRVRYRPPGGEWRVTPLRPLNDDRHRCCLELDVLGRWELLVEGWVDELASWQRLLARKLDASEPAEVISHLRAGVPLLCALEQRVSEPERARCRAAANALDGAERDLQAARAAAFDPTLGALASAHPDPACVSVSAPALALDVEPLHARFSAWYEFFPRSCGARGVHGTFRDCESRLRYIAAMGFDIVYLPPIHPIGVSHRKGKDNALRAQPGEPGSPWAIGAREGGHKHVHPQLGTIEDFRWLLARAAELGLRVAVDVALQVSPDHPYVREHPEWFVHRPDGTIQYAENPPKTYQDIYPFDFQCAAAPALWPELVSVFEFWIEQGVRIFRVDNPHTKSLAFWRYCLARIKRSHPDVVLLAEAFTRPKLMYALAKLGFSQSYTYFTWRNTKRELIDYFTTLTQSEVAEFLRPNLWPNTPDILPESLQFGGRPVFVQRLVLAATLGSSYGIYGPAFELMDATARPGSDEYADNEKYELRSWDVDRDDSLRALITRVNAIRRANPALHDNRSLRFHACENDSLLCYSKRAGDNVIVVVVNLDPRYIQSGFVELDLGALGVPEGEPLQAHDLLGDGRYLWSSARCYVELDPQQSAAQIFLLRSKLRSEHDFDYFA